MRIQGLIDANLTARISRVTTGDGDCFELSVTDMTSGLIVIEMRMDSEQFANLMTNRECVSFQGQLNKSTKLGKRHEAKHVVDYPEGTGYGDNDPVFLKMFDKAEAEEHCGLYTLGAEVVFLRPKARTKK
jgi:hypothetical protein